MTQKHVNKKHGFSHSSKGTPIRFPNMSKGEQLSWNNEVTAHQLFKEVLDDEKNLHQLLNHGLPEVEESSSFVNSSSDGGQHSERHRDD